MKVARSDRLVVLVALVGMVAALAMLVQPLPISALPDYATKTGQACGVCHVNPAGGGALTARGQAFAAVPNHAADPAGAFAQSGAAAQPTATPTAAPPPAVATPTVAAKPAATATPGVAATPTPGALPRTGGLPVAPVLLGGSSLLLVVGWSLRKLFQR